MDFTISLNTIGKINQIAAYQKHQEGQPQLFAKGQILKGLVSAKADDGSFMIDFGGKQFSAATKIPLQPGQPIEVEVISTSPRIILRTLGDSLTQQIGKSVHLLDQQHNFLPALKNLSHKLGESPLLSATSKNLLDFFTTILDRPSSTPLSGEQIQAFVQKMGLDFERHLASGEKYGAIATLKGALIEIANSFKGDEKILTQANQLLKSIELFQNINVRMLNESIFFFPLPFPFFEQAFLMVSPDDHTGRDQGSSTEKKKYSLHLKLEGLGNLQIDILQQNDTVSLHFIAQDAVRAGFLKEQEEELRNLLTALRLESANFSAGDVDPIRHLLSRFTGEDTGILNTRA